MKKYIQLFFATLLLFPFSLQAQVITTIAGNGNEGYIGDTSNAILAELHWPKSLALDTFGNLYIADAINNCIRKVKTNGIITTVAGDGFEAGTGSGGFSGEDSAATTAHLFDPEGVAVDRVGNIYIADAYNNRIRKVDTSGKIITIAGTGTVGFFGDGAAATAAMLDTPTRVAVDTFGNIFFVDRMNQRIRKIDVTGVITTIAGNGNVGYSGDGGTATAAKLNYPADLALDKFGNIFIADQVNECVRKVDLSGNISTYAGINAAGFRGDGGMATLAMLFDPVGVAVDTAGNLYISDLGNARIRMVNDTGMITTIVGNGTEAFSGDGGLAKLAEIWFPQGLAVTTKGNLYIADQGNNRVRYIGIKATFVKNVNTPLASLGIYPNPSQGIFHVNVSSDVDEPVQIYVTNLAGVKVTVLDAVTNHPKDVNMEMPSGVYLLSAITAHGVSSSRLVVN
jgi:sugar lactone lactonase YvrE